MTKCNVHHCDYQNCENLQANGVEVQFRNIATIIAYADCKFKPYMIPEKN